jgi:HEAT repeat protein
MKRSLAAVAMFLCFGAALWYYRGQYQRHQQATGSVSAVRVPEWLDRLYSRNPAEVAAAAQQLTALGPGALPVIKSVLEDSQSEAERLKAALKACGILAQDAAPLVPEVTALLHEPALTAEAAVALSYMGREAFEPLREGSASDDPVVRREALRSIGKLKDRAKLDGGIVIPILIEHMKDSEPSVRAVAATYLGIIHEGSARAIPALVAGLQDGDAEVRRASAAALGEFGPSAAPAMRALKKAASDSNSDVAREAGLSIVKLQQK